MAAETATKQLYICTSCGFIYDPDEGDPDGGVPPGTAFDDIPDDWFCPVCGARKADFEPYDEYAFWRAGPVAEFASTRAGARVEGEIRRHPPERRYRFNAASRRRR